MLLTPARRKLSAPALLLEPKRNQDFFDRVTAADRGAGDFLGLETGVIKSFGRCLDGLHYAGYLGVSNGVFAQAASVIKASCFLCGARTLTGILTPLAADMQTPTNFNFTNLRYDRRLGLLGDGATTYLDSGRSNSADPQNNKHVSVYVTQLGANALLGSGPGGGVNGVTQLRTLSSQFRCRNNEGATEFAGGTALAGLFCNSRNSQSSYLARNNTTSTVNNTAIAPNNTNIHVFNIAGLSLFTTSRISFYSIGEALPQEPSFLDYIITRMANDLASSSL